jgi:hypothetical protein
MSAMAIASERQFLSIAIAGIVAGGKASDRG